MNTTSPERTITDPILAEVRRLRDEMFRDANYDLDTLYERLRDIEREYPDRMIRAHDAPTK